MTTTPNTRARDTTTTPTATPNISTNMARARAHTAAAPSLDDVVLDHPFDDQSAAALEPGSAAGAEGRMLHGMGSGLPPELASVDREHGAWVASVNALISRTERLIRDAKDEFETDASDDLERYAAYSLRNAPIGGAETALEVALQVLKGEREYALRRFISKVNRYVKDDLEDLSFRFGGAAGYERLTFTPSIPGIPASDSDAYRACASVAEDLRQRFAALLALVEAPLSRHDARARQKALTRATALRAWAWGALVVFLSLAEARDPVAFERSARDIIEGVRCEPVARVGERRTHHN